LASTSDSGVERVAGKDGRGHADLGPAEVGDGLLADVGDAHADQDGDRQGRGDDAAAEFAGLAYSASKCSGCVFMVSSVNQVLSASVMVRPGRCS
jgi:hypothetical protein